MKVRLLTLALVLYAAPALAQEFKCAFEEPGSGQNYCFAGKATPVIPSGRTITHLPTGGWNGTGGAQITVDGCKSGCNTSTNQGNIGWFTPPLGGTYKLGTPRYIRWRMKVLTQFPAPSSGKFILMGRDDERFMALWQGVESTAGCTPSGQWGSYWDSVKPVTPQPSGVWTESGHWRLSKFPTGASDYSFVVPHINIGWSCAAAALVARNTAPPIKPNHRGAVSDQGWTSHQIEVTPGACGAADIRYWVNNNTYEQPDSQALNMTLPNCAMGVDDWAGSVHFGGYWGVASPTSSLVFVVDDFEISNTFDPKFFKVQGKE